MVRTLGFRGLSGMNRFHAMRCVCVLAALETFDSSQQPVTAATKDESSFRFLHPGVTLLARA